MTYNILGIGAVEWSWGNVKTIKSGKLSDTSNNVSEKQRIVYKSACSKSARVERNQSDSNKNYFHIRHVWNDEVGVFDHQFKIWDFEKVTNNKP